MNEKIEHILFGEGKIIKQEADRISIVFSQKYGTRQFVYPDAFEKYLKFHDLEVERSVLEELNNKQKQIAEEKLLKQQEYESTHIAKKASEKSLLAEKKKSETKSKVSKSKK